MLACAFVAEFVDAQVVKTLGFLGVVGSSPTARAALRIRAVAEPFCAFVLWLSRLK